MEDAGEPTKPKRAGSELTICGLENDRPDEETEIARAIRMHQDRYNISFASHILY
jgi:hypothetical protein